MCIYKSVSIKNDLHWYQHCGTPYLKLDIERICELMRTRDLVSQILILLHFSIVFLLDPFNEPFS